MDGLRYMSEIALGREMSDDEYACAKARAEKKQKRIYDREQRKQVLDISYLAQLVSEAVKEQELSIATLLISGVLMNG